METNPTSDQSRSEIQTETQKRACKVRDVSPTNETSPFNMPEYWTALTTYTKTVAKSDVTILEFASLQRLNIIHLQNELALIKSKVVGSNATIEKDLENLRRLLRDYGNNPPPIVFSCTISQAHHCLAAAIRDLDYLSRLPRVQDPESILDKRITLANAFPDIVARPGAPYDSAWLTLRQEAVRQADGVREFLRKHLHRRLAWSAEERDANRLRYNQRRPPLVYSKILDRLARFLIAVGGGCSVVVPMLIMSLEPSQIKSLVTVSLSVVLFALVMSLTFQTDNKDTLTATATYAAVLVVFVGTSGTA